MKDSGPVADHAKAHGPLLCGIWLCQGEIQIECTVVVDAHQSVNFVRLEFGSSNIERCARFEVTIVAQPVGSWKEGRKEVVPVGVSRQPRDFPEAGSFRKSLITACLTTCSVSSREEDERNTDDNKQFTF